MEDSNKVLAGYLKTLCAGVEDEYNIEDDDSVYQGIKSGLRNEDGTGVLAGVTRIGSVQGYYMQDGARVAVPGKLYYRGIDVEDIVAFHLEEKTFGFEEVAYLLLLGKLPNKKQFDDFKAVLSHAHTLPNRFIDDIIVGGPSGNMMNVLSRCVLALYSYDESPEDNSIQNMMRQSIELIGRFPTIIANAYAVMQHRYNGKSLYLHNPKEELSTSENFLRMLRHDKTFTKEEALLFDLMLILHAEHGGGNNSTFTTRVLSSTGTDTYSAIAGGISSLKGPLHGGANAKVGEMLENVRKSVSDIRDEDKIRAYLIKIINKEVGDKSGKIYGLGHAVYTVSDPRSVITKNAILSMAKDKDCLDEYKFIEAIERIGVELLGQHKHRAIKLCANVDLYSGMVYQMLGISEDLFTPIFALSRISGWCAHRIEEVLTCHRIIRPAYRVYEKEVPYVGMSERF
ncbi:MAG: citrate synthase [Treponema sp.]|jgi:citrate synthase|nr:citrate synthase [Treponema sp.]